MNPTSNPPCRTPAVRSYLTAAAPQYVSHPAIPGAAGENPSAAVRMSNRGLSIADIIRSGEFTIRDAPPETALLADRRDVAQLGLHDLIEQIQDRIELYQRNLRDIAYATVAATNAIHTWWAERGWPSDRQIDNLHKTLQGLYEQERGERVSLWRDLSRIRQALPEWAQQYLASARKIDLLQSEERDAP